jgi:hypothetical protein
MIPKGLLVSVVAGVLASGALGVYFMKLHSQEQEIKFVDGPSLSILSDKPDYALGENVTIRLVNSGTTTITFTNDLPSIRIRALDGTTLFSVSFDGLTLDPTQEYLYEWNQLKNDNAPVLEGRYVVDSYTYENKRELGDSITINILR